MGTVCSELENIGSVLPERIALLAKIITKLTKYFLNFAVNIVIPILWGSGGDITRRIL